MKRYLLTFAILILFFSFTSSVFAKIETKGEELDGLKILRTAPDSCFANQKIWITIELENKGRATKEINFIERLGEAEFDKSQAKYIETEYGEKFWYYEWKAKLPSGEKTTLAYWLSPKSFGSYVISPAKISIDDEVFYAKSWDIRIECRADGKCDISSGENYLACPEDCQTGVSDNICDFASDGRCDPDCEKDADLDCQEKPAPKPYKILDKVGGLALLVAALLGVGVIGIKARKRVTSTLR